MINIRPISSELTEKARIELNEVESRIPEDIFALRQWIEKQPHLTARTDDQFLISFLRGCKYSLEKAKKKFDFYHTFKTISPDVFLNNQITEKSLKLTRIGPFLPLPKPLKPDGPRLILIRSKGVDPKEFSFLDLAKNQQRVLEILMLEDDNCVIGGVVSIIDLTDLSLSFILRADPVLIRKQAVFSDKARPLRVAGVHIINIPKEAASFVRTVQHLMPKKITERLMIHSTTESLYEHVPQEYLPEEYGGQNGRISETIDNWEKLLLKYKNYFEEDNKYRSNEELRIGNKLTSESVFGLEGSFRKLEID